MEGLGCGAIEVRRTKRGGVVHSAGRRHYGEVQGTNESIPTQEGHGGLEGWHPTGGR